MPTMLHVGCGQARKANTTPGFNRPEWSELRFDIDPSAAPDILGTITDMCAVGDGAVDAVFSSHNIEHVYAYEVTGVLREFLRVLRPDGYLVITCPDLQAVAVDVAAGRLVEPLYQSPAGPITAHDILYGHGASLARGQHYMAHRSGFTLRSLYDQLKRAGFLGITGMRRPAYRDLWFLAGKSPRTEAELSALATLHFPRVQRPTPAP